MIIPGRSHVAKLLVEHYHDRVKHQGRVLTESAIRNAGYWIVGVRKAYQQHPTQVCHMQQASWEGN